MSTQRTLIALDWLLPVLEDEFSAIEQRLQTRFLSDVARDEAIDWQGVGHALHQVAGALTLVNKPLLAKLGATLEQLVAQMAERSVTSGEIYAVVQGSRLLRYEIAQLQSKQQYHEAWVVERINYLQTLLGQAALTDDERTQLLGESSVAVDATQDNLMAGLPLFEALALPAVAEDQAEKRESLIALWRFHSLQLLKLRQNDSAALTGLADIASFFATQPLSLAQRQLWQVAALWLSSQADNDAPTPSHYVTLLGQLEDLLSNTVAAALGAPLAPLAIDILLQLASLPKQSGSAKAVLSATQMDKVASSGSLFHQLLADLQQAMESVQQPQVMLSILTKMQTSLANRGWVFYEHQLAQIMDDIRVVAEDSRQASHFGDQVTRQLQELYTQMLQTAETLESKIGVSRFSYAADPKQEALRYTRIDLEQVKMAFNHYVQSHELSTLVVDEALVNMVQVFGGLGLTQSQTLMEQLRLLFGRLTEHQMTVLSWEATDAIAEMIAQFELFLDHLSYQHIDGELLAQTQPQLNRANLLINQLIDTPLAQTDLPLPQKTYDKATLVYDDTGEHELHVTTRQPTTTHETSEIGLNGQVDQPMSAAYMDAKNALKDDNFGYADPDIQEIFSEEAQEVFGELDSQLMLWQTDPSDFSLLKDIRRGFHTLKGSGRMVGALQLGESAWAVENLLNGVLEGGLAVSDELVRFVIEVRQKMAVLAADFAAYQTPSIDPAIIVLQANNLLKHQPLMSGLPDNLPTSQALTASPVAGCVSAAPVMAEAMPEVAVKPPLQSEQSLPDTTDAASLPSILQQAYAELPVVEDNILDEDIQFIYVEEAQEVIETLIPLYDKWQFNTANTDLLQDIRRGFHTLKGSGRIVGANQLGELAWSIENLLNQVLEQRIAVTDNIVRLLGDVTKGFPALIQCFADNQKNYPDSLRRWAAFANVYAKHQGDALAYPLGHEATDNQPTVHTTVAMSDMPSLLPTTAAPVAMAYSDEVGLGDALFLEEAGEILAEMNRCIAQAYLEIPVAISDDIIRAFHTLRGGAALAEFDRVRSLSAVLESSLGKLMREEVALDTEALDVLSDASDTLQQYLNDYQTHGVVALQPQDASYIADVQAALLSVLDTARTPHVVAVKDLLALGIDDLLDSDQSLAALPTLEEAEVVAYATVRESQAEKLANASMSMSYLALPETLQIAYQRLMQYPSFAKDNRIIGLLEVLHEQLIGLFDTIAAGLQARIDINKIEQLTQILAEQKRLADMAMIEYEAIETDAELLDIFVESVTVKRVHARQILNKWQNNLPNLALTRELRHLFKQLSVGASIVGLRSISELSERAETLYQAISEQKLPSNPDMAQIMQRLHETMYAQLIQLRSHQRSFFADEFIAQLDGILTHALSIHEVVPKVPLIVEGNAEELADANGDGSPETLSNRRQDPMYLQEVVNNFEQNRLETWRSGEPDPDILNIFLEEAKELVDSSSTHLQAFRSNTNDIASLQALQRELHTIKGGARMVGAEGVANLAHEMETIYEELGSRRKPATRMVGNLLATCHDWLANALVVLENVYNPKEPTALIRALQEFFKNPDSLKEIPLVSLASQLEKIEIYRNSLVQQEEKARDLTVMPLMRGNFEQEQEQSNLNAEMLRISAALMERMINLSAESAINRARIEMGITGLTHSIEEMGATVQRLADQLRRMETELEIQILAQIADAHQEDVEFDPLEMDQYSALNQLSKSLSESASDLLDIKTTMLERTRDTENLLLQLSRTQSELQEGLMDSRTVPFSRITSRLQRITRQTATELGKTVELRILNDDGEIDRNILERITSPLEHMLRNAIDHGIEKTQERLELNKPRTGLITLEVLREGGEIVIHLTDDGRGINVDAVRNKAIEQKLIAPDDTSLKPLDIMQYIFSAGLSTAKAVSQISGRGVGMDVVQSEVKQLGGMVLVDSERSKGSRFTMRLPLTVAVSDALVVRAGDKSFAVPLVQIERVVRVNAETIYQFHASAATTLPIDGEEYRVRYLNQVLYGSDPLDAVRQQATSVPVIIIRSETGQRIALQVDALDGSRIEVVVKPLGRQLSHIAGISAATIMGDGSVMLILDLIALMRNMSTAVVKAQQQKVASSATPASRKPIALIVDDSVTVRKVTSRLLERNGYEAYVATDGIDALEKLQQLTPDVMLLDIEMPRMDGFELANQIRHTKRLEKLPIMMITSRMGEKHRERAISIGVNAYMGKPFQEQALLDNIARLVQHQAPLI